MTRVYVPTVPTVAMLGMICLHPSVGAAAPTATAQLEVFQTVVASPFLGTKQRLYYNHIGECTVPTDCKLVSSGFKQRQLDSRVLCLLVIPVLSFDSGLLAAVEKLIGMFDVLARGRDQSIPDCDLRVDLQGLIAALPTSSQQGTLSTIRRFLGEDHSLKVDKQTYTQFMRQVVKYTN